MLALKLPAIFSVYLQDFFLKSSPIMLETDRNETKKKFLSVGKIYIIQVTFL